MPLDYLAIGFGGWGQLPVGYIGYILEASPKSSFFRKVPYVIQKKKKGEEVPFGLDIIGKFWTSLQTDGNLMFDCI